MSKNEEENVEEKEGKKEREREMRGFREALDKAESSRFVESRLLGLLLGVSNPIRTRKDAGEKKTGWSAREIDRNRFLERVRCKEMFLQGVPERGRSRVSR